MAAFSAGESANLTSNGWKHPGSWTSFIPTMAPFASSTHEYLSSAPVPLYDAVLAKYFISRMRPNALNNASTSSAGMFGGRPRQ